MEWYSLCVKPGPAQARSDSREPGCIGVEPPSLAEVVELCAGRDLEGALVRTRGVVPQQKPVSR